METRTDAEVRQPDVLIAPGPLPGVGTHDSMPDSPGQGNGRCTHIAGDEVSSANRNKIN